MMYYDVRKGALAMSCWSTSCDFPYQPGSRRIIEPLFATGYAQRALHVISIDITQLCGMIVCALHCIAKPFIIPISL